MKRIFIAVKVEAGNALVKLISDIRSELSGENIKWADIGNLHITLAFLGDTEEKSVAAISEMLGSRLTGTGAFELVLRGLGLFRSLADPRIIWTGIDRSVELEMLYKNVAKGLSETGIIFEEHTFKPHLTLGRIRNLKDKEIIKRVIEKNYSSEIQIVPVIDVILYESILLKPGPFYKPLGKFNL